MESQGHYHRKNSTSHYEELSQILGKEFVVEDIESPMDFIDIASRGLHPQVIENFREYFHVSRGQAAHMLHVSEPTLYRWMKAEKELDQYHGVKLFELADLFLYGSGVFGSKENFLKWLSLPNTAIGGREPLELVEVPGGVSKVRDLLGRIEHGIYS
jgi:putative toxin-antitoxin system antitoxin component (TIGR02293 family)